MALTPDALTNLADLKAYLLISSNQHDDLMTSLVNAVSALFNAHTGRNLTARDYSPDPQAEHYDQANAILDGSGYPELLLPQYPIVALDSLTLDGAILPQAQGSNQWGYVLDVSAGVVSLAGGAFTRGKANVTATYRAGYETIPPDLAQAALEQTAVRFQESAAGGGRLGVAARTLPDGSVSYASTPLLSQVAAVLDRYRNRSLL
jgi:hypothetical protein